MGGHRQGQDGDPDRDEAPFVERDRGPSHGDRDGPPAIGPRAPDDEDDGHRQSDEERDRHDRDRRRSRRRSRSRTPGSRPSHPGPTRIDRRQRQRVRHTHGDPELSPFAARQEPQQADPGRQFRAGSGMPRVPATGSPARRRRRSGSGGCRRTSARPGWPSAKPKPTDEANVADTMNTGSDQRRVATQKPRNSSGIHIATKVAHGEKPEDLGIAAEDRRSREPSAAPGRAVRGVALTGCPIGQGVDRADSRSTATRTGSRGQQRTTNPAPSKTVPRRRRHAGKSPVLVDRRPVSDEQRPLCSYSGPPPSLRPPCGRRTAR